MANISIKFHLCKLEVSLKYAKKHKPQWAMKINGPLKLTQFIEGKEKLLKVYVKIPFRAKFCSYYLCKYLH